VKIGVTVLAILGLAGASRDEGTAVPYTLPAAVRAHLKSETLTPVEHVRDLAPSAREALRSLFEADSLEMADPGAEFQSTDAIVTPSLPVRRLIAAGCSRDHCLIHYERGGISHSYQIVLLALSKEGARPQWGGSTSGAIAGLAELKAQVVEGRVRGRVSYW